MLKLKLQYFGHLMQRTDSFEKTLTLGKIEGRGEGDDRGWNVWIASLTQWTWVWVDSMSWWWTGRPGVLWFMGLQRVGHDWAELNWTTSRKPNRLKNQQYFLNPVGKRRTQGKPLPLSLERQTGEYRSHNLLEQRLGRRNSSNQGSARKWVLLEAHADKSDG